ncbi:MAG: hypothetical protein R2849_01590 [Thermomicrobiales bacterium]
MQRTTTGTYLDRILDNTIDELRERMSAQPQEVLADLISSRQNPVSRLPHSLLPATFR